MIRKALFPFWERSCQTWRKQQGWGASDLLPGGMKGRSSECLPRRKGKRKTPPLLPRARHGGFGKGGVHFLLRGGGTACGWDGGGKGSNAGKEKIRTVRLKNVDKGGRGGRAPLVQGKKGGYRGRAFLDKKVRSRRTI